MLVGVLERISGLAEAPHPTHCAQHPQSQCHSIHRYPVSDGPDDEGADMTALLRRLQSPANAVRAEAEECMAGMVACDVGRTMAALSREIADPWKPSDVRHIAAIIVKNLLAGSYRRDGRKNCEWGQINVQLRELRQALLKGLCADQREVGMACAQALAQLGSLEQQPQQCLPAAEELIFCLTELAMTGSSLAVSRQSALWCLSFTCEARSRMGECEVDAILTAAASGLQAAQEMGSCRATYLAAGAALASALRFARQNFERPRERDALVSLVLGMAASSEPEQCRRGFECVAEMCTLHYASVLPSLHAIGRLLDGALHIDTDRGVVVFAADALRAICDEDVYFRKDEGHLHGLAFQCLTTPALPHLLLHLRPDDDGGDECMCDSGSDTTTAAADSLAAVARALGDGVLPPVLGFAQGAVVSQDWKERCAAAAAVGAVAGGISEVALRRVLNEFLPTILAACATTRLQERREKQSMLGCIEQIMTAVSENNCPTSELIGPQTFSQTVDVLRQAVREEPAVAEMACQALAAAVAAAAGRRCPQLARQQSTSVLLPHFSGVVGALLSRAESVPRSNEGVSLQMSAFSAVRDVVTQCPEDCCPMLADLATVVNGQALDTGRRLELLAARATTEQQEAYVKRLRELQVFLCTLLKDIFLRVINKSGADLRGRLPACEDVMATVESVMRCNAHFGGAEAVALMCVLAHCWGVAFARHMPALWRAGYRTATDVTSPEECEVALRTFHCLCASQHAALMEPYLDILLQLVLSHLSRATATTIALDVRLACLSLLGDIASLQQTSFTRHFAPSMSALACSTGLALEAGNQRDEAWELQGGVLQAYTRVLQSLPMTSVSSHFVCGKGALQLQSLLALMEAAFMGRRHLREEQRVAILSTLMPLLAVIAERIQALRPALLRDGWHHALLEECRCMPSLQSHVAITQQLILRGENPMGLPSIP